MTLASVKVTEIKEHGTFINLPGRRWVDQVVEGFQYCKRGDGSAAYDEQTGEMIFFYQDLATKVVLAIGYEKRNGNAAGLRYAFMTSNGSIMSDADYCGIINGKEQTLEECRKMLIRGLVSFTPQ